jgi:phosphate transport system substrate-binding protein
VTLSRTSRIGGLAFAATIAFAACGGGATPPPASSQDAGSGQGTPPPAAGSIQMSGAGATFPFPIYSQWFYQYAFVDPSVKFNYQSIGSGGGIQQITAKTVDFGASDAILSDQQLAAAPGLQMFPSVAGAEAIAYNVSELADADPIVLDGPTLANIFLGRITKWNDPALVALNPGVALPDKDIVVVHRSDGSGTTYIFTDYLSKVSSDWKASVGNSTSVEWPVGLGGKGNEGVSGTLGQTDGAIGYVELAYAIANKLKYAKMKNAAGSIVEAGIPSTQAAMADFGTDLGDKLAISIVNGPGKDSYPIAGYTYLLLYMDQSDCTKAQKLVEFVKWAHTADGDKYATDLNYVTLPQEVTSLVLNKLDQITCNGQPLPGA